MKYKIWFDGYREFEFKDKEKFVKFVDCIDLAKYKWKAWVSEE